MKTIKTITLAAIMIMISTSVALSNNYKTYRILTPEGWFIEIISKIEKPVKEIIPGYESFVSEIRSKNIVNKSDIAFYDESEVQDDLFVSFSETQNASLETYAEVVEFIDFVSTTEETVDDIPFDTKAIFDQIQKEKKELLRQDIIASILMIEEEEEVDNAYVFEIENITLLK